MVLLLHEAALVKAGLQPFADRELRGKTVIVASQDIAAGNQRGVVGNRNVRRFHVNSCRLLQAVIFSDPAAEAAQVEKLVGARNDGVGRVRIRTLSYTARLRSPALHFTRRLGESSKGRQPGGPSHRSPRYPEGCCMRGERRGQGSLHRRLQGGGSVLP